MREREDAMHLRPTLRDPEMLITVGMSCLAAGVVAQAISYPLPDFWRGFVAGLSAVLLGCAIFFNLRGFVLRRSRPKFRPGLRR